MTKLCGDSSFHKEIETKDRGVTLDLYVALNGWMRLLNQGVITCTDASKFKDFSQLLVTTSAVILRANENL